LIGSAGRDLAMFDLAIDSKLRGCDIVKIKIGDLVSGGRVRSRAIVVQQNVDEHHSLTPCAAIVSTI
jgi:hypothetical protein